MGNILLVGAALSGEERVRQSPHNELAAGLAREECDPPPEANQTGGSAETAAP